VRIRQRGVHELAVVASSAAAENTWNRSKYERAAMAMDATAEKIRGFCNWESLRSRGTTVSMYRGDSVLRQAWGLSVVAQNGRTRREWRP
jgi:hypothetical protein